MKTHTASNDPHSGRKNAREEEIESVITRAGAVSAEEAQRMKEEFNARTRGD